MHLHVSPGFCIISRALLRLASTSLHSLINFMQPASNLPVAQLEPVQMPLAGHRAPLGGYTPPVGLEVCPELRIVWWVKYISVLLPIPSYVPCMSIPFWVYAKPYLYHAVYTCMYIKSVLCLVHVHSCLQCVMYVYRVSTVLCPCCGSVLCCMCIVSSPCSVCMCIMQLIHIVCHMPMPHCMPVSCCMSLLSCVFTCGSGLLQDLSRDQCTNLLLTNIPGLLHYSFLPASLYGDQS